MSLIVLSEIFHAQGRLDEAHATATNALACQREAGLVSEPENMVVLAGIQRDAGRLVEALDLARTAAANAHDSGQRRIEAYALSMIGTIHLYLGDADRAIEHHEQAVQLGRGFHMHYVQAEALVGLADAQLRAGEVRRAADSVAAALAIARAAGYRILEGQALTALAAIRLGEGQPGAALEVAEEALANHGETGHRLGAARTHLVADLALREAGRDAEAQVHRDRAYMLAPWPEHARAVAGAGFEASLPP
jgi:tetratricopeptide (TPR) repeat protein